GAGGGTDQGRLVGFGPLKGRTKSPAVAGGGGNPRGGDGRGEAGAGSDRRAKLTPNEARGCPAARRARTPAAVSRSVPRVCGGWRLFGACVRLLPSAAEWHRARAERPWRWRASPPVRRSLAPDLTSSSIRDTAASRRGR